MLENLNLDYLGEVDAPDMDIAPIGVRSITLFHPNYTVHDKTSIRDGGFGISLKHAPEEFGKVEKVMTLTKKEIEYRTCQDFEAALIDVSPSYCIVKPNKATLSINPNEKTQRIPAFQTFDGFITRTAVSLIFVLSSDPSRQLFQMTVQGENSEKGFAFVRQVRQLALDFSREISRAKGKNMNIHSFGFWLRVGYGAKYEVGRNETSYVVPPVIKMPDLSVATLANCVVSPEDYRLFGDLRKQTQDLIKSGYYAGQEQTSTALAIA